MAKDRMREDANQVDWRLMHIALQGMPTPDGFKLPAQDLKPPRISDPSAVDQVRQEVAALKKANYGSWAEIPDDVGRSFVPGHEGGWDKLSGTGKVGVMDHWVSWRGVSMGDKGAVIAAEVRRE
jgi:hypothetical protein